MPNKGEIDLKKIKFDKDVDNDEVKDLDPEGALHLNDGLADNKSTNIENIRVINQYDKHQNYVGAPNNNLQQQNQYFGRGEHHDSDANDEGNDNNGYIDVVEDNRSSDDNNNNGNGSNDSQLYDNSNSQSREPMKILMEVTWHIKLL